jgi:hypothetical protein
MTIFFPSCIYKFSPYMNSLSLSLFPHTHSNQQGVPLSNAEVEGNVVWSET